MTLVDLLDQFRRWIDDYPDGREPADPTWEVDDSDLIWKNPELMIYWNTVKKEVCRRHPIVDRDTLQDKSAPPADLCEIQLQQGITRYPISRKILQVRNVHRASDQRPVEKVNLDFLDYRRIGWPGADEGAPKNYLEDWSAYDIYVYPPPDDSGEKLLLTVGRMPLADDVWDDRANEIADLPILADDMSDALVFGMMELAFQKRDADAYDPEKSAQYADQFTARIGPRRTLEQLRAEQLASNFNRTALMGRRW